MKKPAWVVPALLLFFIVGMSTVTRADDITYTVDLGTNLVTGTITTNGTIGEISDFDIVSYSLTVNDGTDPPAVISSSDVVYDTQDATNLDGLTATATNISFDFTEPAGDNTTLSLEDETTNYVLCYDGNVNCGVSINGPYVSGTAINGISIVNVTDGVIASDNESGDLVIATVVATPEPGTAMLLLAGIGLLVVLAMRKRAGPVLFG